MADPKSRARVARLLSGTFRPDDLTGLFLYARDHCDGRETVAEIGHFIAHHHERNKGIVTRATRDWFTVARFHFSRFGPGGPHNLHAQKLPVATKEYFEIAANRIDARIIRKSTGFNRSEAHKIASNLADRLSVNPDGTWAMAFSINKKELDLIQCLISNLVVRPAFDAERLVNEFFSTLKSNNLISKAEIRDHGDSISRLVQLYAVSAMHNCVVQIGDGSTTILKAAAEANQIVIRASVPSPAPGRPNVNLACDMFIAHLDPATHCDAEMLAAEDWDFEIEISLDRLLAPFR
jgi:hypothetical protein